MTDLTLPHRRLHNLLLIQNLFAAKGSASPFTLILDSIEQSAKPLIAQYIANAQTSKTDTIYISYETPQPPKGVTAFVKARRKDPIAVQREITSHRTSGKPTLLILDTLHPLLLATPNLPTYLSALLHPPHTTLLATHHTDIPLPPHHTTKNPYTPSPPLLLRHLATTILTPHPLSQVLAQKSASDRSLPPPVFGLAEARDGVVVGRGANAWRGGGGYVVRMEHRRRSGRGVEEVFLVGAEGGVGLLDDFVGWRGDSGGGVGGKEGAGEGEGATFELGLTDRQWRDREGVVLPYFDAQARGAEGVGEGGRILYDMGVEDDFDEEEDEV